MKVEQHREARAEVLGVVARYAEEAGSVVADAFLAALDAAVTVLEEHPDRGAAWRGLSPELGVRRLRVLRFPFVLAYVIERETVVIVACAHMSRRPGYWTRRLRTIDAR